MKMKEYALEAGTRTVFTNVMLLQGFAGLILMTQKLVAG
jgi:hypothetical protein